MTHFYKYIHDTFHIRGISELQLIKAGFKITGEDTDSTYLCVDNATVPVNPCDLDDIDNSMDIIIDAMMELEEDYPFEDIF